MDAQPGVAVRVAQRFNASPERVFDAWLDPATIRLWMFGPAQREEEILHLAVDARVGGRFSFLVRREGKEIDHVGAYLTIDRPHRLVFTWAVAEQKESSRVGVEIAPRDPGAVLALTHELHPHWSGYASRVEAGWTKMLAVLAEVLG
ncbi:MAG: SRPBCC domain-containing protein [Rhodocyclales bacterium]|nr:SRPBCC domain-containing protein [Rhodocyclales bacterium]